jgi:hypothetical protein
MKKSLAALVCATACALAPQAALARETGWINVLEVGGQVTHTFVVVSESVGSELGCPSNRIVIAAGTFDTEAHRRFYASMVTAMVTGAKIRLAASACFDRNYPTMSSTDYWFVKSPGT